MASNAYEVGRFFSFAEVTWKISNISLAICPLNMAIDSLNFQISGAVETSWKVALRASDEKDEIKIHLKRLGTNLGSSCLQDEMPSLKVKWMANVLDSNGELALKSEKEFFFKVDDTLEVQKFDFSKVVRALPQLGPDDLTIKCYMIVVFREGVKFPVHVSDGLKVVYETMAERFGNYYFPDFCITIGKDTFPLHLEMLSGRGDGLNRLIAQQGNNTVTLLNFNELSAKALFRFFYTGDLDYVLSYPQITISEHIERLGIYELENAYPKEKIEIESIIENNEFSFLWRIENAKHIEDSLSGPELSENGMESRWLLSLHPKGPINATPDEQKYVFLEAFLSESTRCIDVSIDITSVNEEDDILHSRRDQKRMNVGDKFSIPLFRRGGAVMKKCLINEDLLLRFKIRVGTGGVFVSLRNTRPAASFIIDNTLSVNNFSRKMRSILHTPMNSDVIIQNDKNYVQAHKFILAMRSTSFYSQLTNVKIRILAVPTVKMSFLRIFLEYLYSGFLEKPDLLVLCHLHELSFMLGVIDLQAYCEQAFVITPANLLKILTYADDYALTRVKKEAFEYAKVMGEDIVGFPDWNGFFLAKAELAVDIMDTFGKKVS